MIKKVITKNYNIYKCSKCYGVFDKGWSDEEAKAEFDKHWPDGDFEDAKKIGPLCDDCYEEFKIWMKKKYLDDYAKRFV